MHVYRVPSGEELPRCRQLAQHTAVEFAEPNYVRRPQQALPSDPDFPVQWALNNTGQLANGRLGPADIDIDWPEAIARYTPVGLVVVGVVDSGVAFDHPELLNLTWSNPAEINQDPLFNGIDDDGNGFVDDFAGWDFFDDDPIPIDENGHGTLVASTISAQVENGEGGSGVAPASLIMPLRVLNDFGIGASGPSVTDICDSTTYAAEMGSRIVNLSLGGSSFSATELLQYQWLDSQGMLVIAAAGNGGLDQLGDDNDIAPTYPASYDVDNIISVAAVDRSGGLSIFSNFGAQSVDVAAPGTDIFGASVTRSLTYRETFEGGAPGWTVGQDCPACSTWSLFEDFFFNTWVSDSQDFFGSPIPYAPNSNTWVQSPTITLPSAGPQLQFRLWEDLDVLDDYLLVEVSTNGIDWELNGVGWGRSSTPPPGVGLPAGSIARLDLSRYAGQNVQLRFRLISDGLFDADGVYIDNVGIDQVEFFQYDGTQYEFLDGTSFAAPLVAGVAALVMSQRPDLTHRQVRDILLSTATTVAPLQGRLATGGMVNAHAALELAISSHCGDVDDDGVLGAGDISTYRSVLTGADTFSPAGLAKCNTLAGGDAEPCSIRDVVALRRQLVGLSSPGIAPTCLGAAALLGR